MYAIRSYYEIVAQWAALLGDVCRAHLQQGRTVSLDCSDVDFIDAGGVAVVCSFPAARVELTDAPGFVITSYSIHYTKLYESASGW